MTTPEGRAGSEAGRDTDAAKANIKMRLEKVKGMLVNNTVNTHGRYFVVPNEVFQLGLSAGAIATYCYLMSLENRRRGDKNRYTCYPSYATIGRAIGRSERSVYKYVQELVEAGLVSTEQTKVTTKDGRRWNGSLRYTLLDPRRAVELFHERQLAKLETGVKKKRKAMRKAGRKKRERRQQPHTEYVASHTAAEPEVLPL
jgi:predicted transcriptional regulator